MGKGWDSQSVKLQNNEKVTPAAASLQGLHQAALFWYLIFVGETIMRSEISTEGRTGIGNQIPKIFCSPEIFQSFDGQGREFGSHPWFVLRMWFLRNKMRSKTEQILLGVFEKINFPLSGRERETELKAGLTTATFRLACPNRTGDFATNSKNIPGIEARAAGR